MVRHIVSVHTWGNTRAWERGRRVSEGKMPSLPGEM
jgi:hypothetical protein